MKTCIIAAAHGDCRVTGTVCVPVMAGSALSGESVPPGYLRDDTGDNISLKNREYCELTALYWAWKNLDADILGLCHYRRYLASAADRRNAMSAEEAEHLLRYYDVILPAERNYHIETNYTQYIHSHHKADLDLTRRIIARDHHEYLESYDRRMADTRGHRFNMFIMRKELADAYCEWLFDILASLEDELDTTSYTGADRRVYGHVAERLLDVWADHHRLRTADTGYIFTGREHLPRKAAAMTARLIRSRFSRHMFNREVKALHNEQE